MNRQILTHSAVRISITALFMAINIVFSSFGVPVPGGRFYLNDIAIVAAALTLDFPDAVIAGGIGAFLGDLLFYPAPMFVSLVVRSVQCAAIYLISRKTLQNKELLSCIIAVTAGALIMIAGYSFGRAYIYSTKEYALIKLPYQILQGAIGAVLGAIIFRKGKLKTLYYKALRRG